ncbi:hypothetical protein IW261DRAFT_1614700 [Armillaria novae-zelandiae]|uniref:Uncharacterized protein n=1 Tax=Armillaria novae-zelandiae TaxID=153914 RepID=A0AA39KI42_9AGAR|nr:hypothetical protein IW261DRAFT_1614700 [Armillaria novae-zelandiae]
MTRFWTGKATADTTCSPSPQVIPSKDCELSLWNRKLVCNEAAYFRTGPIIVAVLLHWRLFGSLSVQLYLYYLAFPKDRQFTKCLAYVVEFDQTTLVTHDAFLEFGSGFGDIEALTEVHFNWLIVPVMSAVVSFVGQGFYAYRIFILSRSEIIPAFVICISLTSSVAAIITGVYSFEANN